MDFLEYIVHCKRKLQPVLSIKGFELMGHVADFSTRTYTITCGIPMYNLEGIQTIFTFYEDATQLQQLINVLYHEEENCKFTVRFDNGEISVNLDTTPEKAVNLISVFISENQKDNTTSN